MLNSEKAALEDLKLQIQQEEQKLPYSEEALMQHRILLDLILKLKNETKSLKITNNYLQKRLDIEQQLFQAKKKIHELEKGNHSLIESRKKWKDRYYKLKKKTDVQYILGERRFGTEYAALKEYVAKDKIKEIIDTAERCNWTDINDIIFELQKILKEHF